MLQKSCFQEYNTEPLIYYQLRLPKQFTETKPTSNQEQLKE